MAMAVNDTDLYMLRSRRDDMVNPTVIAPDFSEEKSYTKGRVVMNGESLYVAKEDIQAGAWDDTKWEKTNVASELLTATHKPGDTEIVTKNIEAIAIENGVAVNFRQGKFNSTSDLAVVGMNYKDIKAENAGKVLAVNEDGTGLEFASGGTNADWDETDETKKSYILNVPDQLRGGVTELAFDTATLNSSEVDGKLTVSAKRMVGATDMENGKLGMVPAPTVNDVDRVLSGSGEWVDVPNSGVPESFIPVFSETETYRAFAVVSHDDKIYRAKASILTAGPWNSSDWTEVTVNDITTTCLQNSTPGDDNLKQTILSATKVVGDGVVTTMIDDAVSPEDTRIMGIAINADSCTADNAGKVVAVKAGGEGIELIDVATTVSHDDTMTGNGTEASPLSANLMQAPATSGTITFGTHEYNIRKIGHYWWVVDNLYEEWENSVSLGEGRGRAYIVTTDDAVRTIKTKVNDLVGDTGFGLPSNDAFVDLYNTANEDMVNILSTDGGWTEIVPTNTTGFGLCRQTVYTSETFGTVEACFCMGMVDIADDATDVADDARIPFSFMFAGAGNGEAEWISTDMLDIDTLNSFYTSMTGGTDAKVIIRLCVHENDFELPGSDGKPGIVPAPKISDMNKCLFGDGTWRNVEFKQESNIFYAYAPSIYRAYSGGSYEFYTPPTGITPTTAKDIKDAYDAGKTVILVVSSYAYGAVDEYYGRVDVLFELTHACTSNWYSNPFYEFLFNKAGHSISYEGAIKLLYNPEHDSRFIDGDEERWSYHANNNNINLTTVSLKSLTSTAGSIYSDAYYSAGTVNVNLCYLNESDGPVRHFTLSRFSLDNETVTLEFNCTYVYDSVLRIDTLKSSCSADEYPTFTLTTKDIQLT